MPRPIRKPHDSRFDAPRAALVAALMADDGPGFTRAAAELRALLPPPKVPNYWHGAKGRPKGWRKKARGLDDRDLIASMVNGAQEP